MALIEYLIHEPDNEIVYNHVEEVESDSEFIPQCQESLSGGIYVYNLIAIPVADKEPENGDFWYKEGKVYKGAEEVTTLSDLFNGALDSNTCYAGTKSYFTMCEINKCFLNRLIDYLNEYLENGCNSLCRDASSIASKKDLLIAFDYVLRYLTNLGDIDEFNKLINLLLSCDDTLCPKSTRGVLISGGCGCGRS